VTGASPTAQLPATTHNRDVGVGILHVPVPTVQSGDATQPLNGLKAPRRSHLPPVTKHTTPIGIVAKAVNKGLQLLRVNKYNIQKVNVGGPGLEGLVNACRKQESVIIVPTHPAPDDFTVLTEISNQTGLYPLTYVDEKELLISRRKGPISRVANRLYGYMLMRGGMIPVVAGEKHSATRDAVMDINLTHFCPITILGQGQRTFKMHYAGCLQPGFADLGVRIVHRIDRDGLKNKSGAVRENLIFPVGLKYTFDRDPSKKLHQLILAQEDYYRGPLKVLRSKALSAGNLAQNVVENSSPESVEGLGARVIMLWRAQLLMFAEPPLTERTVTPKDEEHGHKAMFELAKYILDQVGSRLGINVACLTELEQLAILRKEVRERFYHSDRTPQSESWLARIDANLTSAEELMRGPIDYRFRDPNTALSDLHTSLLWRLLRKIDGEIGLDTSHGGPFEQLKAMRAKNGGYHGEVGELLKRAENLARFLPDYVEGTLSIDKVVELLCLLEYTQTNKLPSFLPSLGPRQFYVSVGNPINSRSIMNSVPEGRNAVPFVLHAVEEGLQKTLDTMVLPSFEGTTSRNGRH